LVIIDPDGGVIDKARFLRVIDSGALIHESMESEDFSARSHACTASLYLPAEQQVKPTMALA